MDIKQIEKVVSEELKVPLKEIVKKGDRKPLHVVGRFMVWSLISYYGLDVTVEELGHMFGYSYTTIVDGRKSLVNKLQKSIWLRNTMENIKRRLEQKEDMAKLTKDIRERELLNKALEASEITGRDKTKSINKPVKVTSWE